MRGLKQNPAFVVRPSGVVVLEWDPEEDLAAIEKLGLPATITVRSSAPYKGHGWFHRWQNGERAQRHRLRVDSDAKVEVGRRHDVIFRFACAMRRWWSSEE